MRGYISVDEDGSAERIPVESTVQVYRDPDRSQEVVVETDDDEVSLGVADATVSRKKGDTAPVQIVPQSELIEIRNVGNTNGVTVQAKGEGLQEELEKGRVTTVRRDSVVEVGYQTRLRLIVERERKNVVHHQGQGNVEFVQGDKSVRNVDASTEVTDAVVNDSRLGSDVEAASPSPTDGTDGSAGAADRSVAVEDAVVNGSRVGSGDGSGRGPEADDTDNDQLRTNRICTTHEVVYSGAHCPACEQERDQSGGRDATEATTAPPGRSEVDANARSDGSATDAAAPTPDRNGDSGADPETKYCIHCGSEIPAFATHCPDCGGNQQ